MYEFLPDATPDYEATLSVSPQKIMTLSGGKEIVIHQGRGINEERIILSDQTKFQLKLQWNILTRANWDTLFNWYHDPDKACGVGKSFWWSAPSQYDAHTYVVRFDSLWDSFVESFETFGVPTMLLYVLGRKPD